MTRDMTITVNCNKCKAEMLVNLEDGHPGEDYDIKIDKALERAGWYANMDGDYCPKCKAAAKAEWER